MARGTRAAIGIATALLLTGMLVPLWAADWTRAGGDLGHTNVSSERTATPLSLIWKYYTGYMRDNPTTPLGVGGKIFFGGVEPSTTEYVPHFYCLSAETGEKVWDAPVDYRIRTPAAYWDGMIYFGTDDGTVYGLDAANGKARWSYKTGRAVRCAPNVDSGMVFIGSSDRKLYAINAAGGDDVWKYPGDDAFNSSPVVAGDRLYAASADGYLVSLEKKTGKPIWRRRVAEGQLSAPLVIKDNTIYAVAADRLLALDTETFGVRWKKQSNSRLTTGIAVTDKSVFLPTPSGWLFAFDPANGDLQWRYHSDTPLTSTPLVVGDVVIVGAEGAMILAIGAERGELRWRYRTEGPVGGEGQAGYHHIAGSPTFCDGSLYVYSDEGNLYRFGAAQPDAVPPLVSLLTPAEGQYVSGWPPLVVGAKVYDPGSGLDESSVQLELDGKVLSHQFDQRNSHIYLEFKVKSGRNEPLEDGPHTVVVKAKDCRGNVVERTWRFNSDKNLPTVTPPQSAPGTAGGVPTG